MISITNWNAMGFFAALETCVYSVVDRKGKFAGTKT